MGDELDLEKLLMELKERVAERKKSGDYPPDLDQSLAQHFLRVTSHRSKGALHIDRNLLKGVEDSRKFDRKKIETDSSILGGALVHRTIGRIVARQVDGILHQVNQYAEAVQAILNDLAQTLDDLSSYTRGDVAGQIEALLDRIGELESLSASPAVALEDVRRRLDEVESKANLHASLSIYNRRFTETLKDSREDSAESYREMAGLFDGHEPVLDFGCGEGVLLQLLKERKTNAFGVDSDADAVRKANEVGLDASTGDPISYLGGLEDQSLGGVAAFQVVQYLSPSDLITLVTLASEKIRLGGLLVIETINPGSVMVHTDVLYRNLVNTRPIHAAFLEFLAKESGFRKTEIRWGSSPQEQVTNTPGDDELRRIRHLLFGPKDYALIAYK